MVEIGREDVVIVSVDGHGTVGQISRLTALPEANSAGQARRRRLRNLA